MGSSVSNLVISQLLFDLFVRIFLSPMRFLLLIGNVVAETPHRTEVRLQNEENAPVVPPNKKFLFSKMKAGKYGSIDTATRPLNLWQIKAGCGHTQSFMGNQYNLTERSLVSRVTSAAEDIGVLTQKWRHKTGIFRNEAFALWTMNSVNIDYPILSPPFRFILWGFVVLKSVSK